MVYFLKFLLLFYLYFPIEDPILCSSLEIPLSIDYTPVQMISENLWEISVNVTLELPDYGILISVCFVDSFKLTGD